MSVRLEMCGEDPTDQLRQGELSIDRVVLDPSDERWVEIDVELLASGHALSLTRMNLDI